MQIGVNVQPACDRLQETRHSRYDQHGYLVFRADMNNNPTEQQEIIQQVEMLQCDRCRKKWQVGWVEPVEGQYVEHTLTCDCGRVLKVVRAAGDHAPLMILQHAYWKTVAACIPALIAGALFPALSDTVILTAYVLSWIGCAATFVNEDNRDFSSLAGITIWSIALVTGAAAIGAIVGHAAWWWWR